MARHQCAAIRQSAKLDALLARCQELHIFLRVEDDTLKYWAPGVKVPCSLKRALVRYQEDIAQLVKLSDPRVCPNRDLHEHAEIYVVAKWRCPYCDQFRAWLDRSMHAVAHAS